LTAPAADPLAASSGHSRRSARTPHGEDGSSLPFVLLCFLIAAFLVAGVTAASSAFLAQRDLQADCDGAAIAAASGIDRNAAYESDLSERSMLPVDGTEAAGAAERYASGTGPDDATLVVSASADADRVTVACIRVVKIPFGNLFGIGGGLTRSTVSTARSPLSR
jgi:uncharacterized membrane protein